MSVLLDALKKAAEDKKNASESVTGVETDSSNSFSDSLAKPDLDLKLAVTDDGYSQIDAIEDTDSENIISSTEHDEFLVSDQEELPTFSLKQPSEVLSDDVNNSETDFQIKLQPEEKLETTSEATSSDNDLASLINSLDIEDSESVNKVGLERPESKSANMLSGLSLEQQTRTDSKQDNQSSIVNSEDRKSSDGFNWSMDDLPGYETPNQVNDEKAQQTNSLSQNPILINGENTPPKINKKYATSTRIIVSLVVVLLFIGIGFYGMLYYQEQNEDLEFSMRKYNLSKMQFTQPKPSSEASKVQQETFEDTSALNIVTDKVISLGSSIKDAVTNQLSENSQKQVVLQDSPDQLPENTSESIASDQLLAQNVATKNIGITAKQSSKTVDNIAGSAKKYSNTKQSSKNIVKSPSSRNSAVVTITTARSSISKAYLAYESGDFKKANGLFKDALEKEPKNINALLGLGGIAIAQGNNYSALSYYQKVLDISPNNIYAFESIANLSGKMTLNKAWENELFEMSLKYPSSAVLQYAKGNVFAKKTDWLAAQESYFNAYALDSVNPDYMVNLAVSYDHLGKYELAAQYYTQALGFASGSNASFDTKHVRDRLVSLRQFISQGY